MTETVDFELIGEQTGVHGGPEQLLKWLAFAGNDERKLLILLAIEDADEPLAKSALYHRLNEFSHPHQIQGDLSSPFQFCTQSLVKIGAVEAEDTQALRFGKHPFTTTGFTTTPETSEFGVPFAVALLDWSLRHPELSLLEVFGSTASKTDTSAPLTHYAVLRDLVKTEDGQRGPSIVRLAKHLQVSEKSKQSTVDRLEDYGIVTVASSNRDNKRRFRITNPYHTEGRGRTPFVKLSQPSRIIYRGLETASQVKEVWGKDEFLTLLLTLNPNIDDTTIASIKHRFGESLKPDTGYLRDNIEVLDAPLSEGLTEVAIAPDKRQAIEELLATIDALFTKDQQAIDTGRQRAGEILYNSEDVSALWTKAFESSSQAISDEHVRQRIIEFVRAAGNTATADTVRASYQAETGRNVTKQTMGKWLSNLVSSRLLAVETSPRTKLKRQPTNHYSVVEDPQLQAD